MLKTSFTAKGIMPGDLWSPCHQYPILHFLGIYKINRNNFKSWVIWLIIYIKEMYLIICRKFLRWERERKETSKQEPYDWIQNHIAHFELTCIVCVFPLLVTPYAKTVPERMCSSHTHMVISAHMFYHQNIRFDPSGSHKMYLIFWRIVQGKNTTYIHTIYTLHCTTNNLLCCSIIHSSCCCSWPKHSIWMKTKQKHVGLELGSYIIQLTT